MVSNYLIIVYVNFWSWYIHSSHSVYFPKPGVTVYETFSYQTMPLYYFQSWLHFQLSCSTLSKLISPLSVLLSKSPKPTKGMDALLVEYWSSSSASTSNERKYEGISFRLTMYKHNWRIGAKRWEVLKTCSIRQQEERTTLSLVCVLDQMYRLKAQL
jgi:hypothetical protein